LPFLEGTSIDLLAQCQPWVRMPASQQLLTSLTSALFSSSSWQASLGSERTVELSFSNLLQKHDAQIDHGALLNVLLRLRGFR
jgi:hypothetical protein